MPPNLGPSPRPRAGHALTLLSLNPDFIPDKLLLIIGRKMLLISQFLISFPLIAIFFFIDQSNIPIIFINKEMKLQYLNIELCDFDIWTTWFWFSLMVRYNVWIFHSRLGLSCEWLVKSNLSKTLQILECASRMACFTSWHSRASREILIFTESSPNSHTQPLH